MSMLRRKAALEDAARWAMREDEAVLREAPPAAATEIQSMLDDPALDDALAQVPRLTDQEILAMRANRRRAIGAGTMLGLAALVGISGWQAGWLAPAGPQTLHYETKRGQQLAVELADGSRIELNGQTSLDVALGERDRTVVMRRGEAYFDIAHRPDQPFTVHAGGSATHVLGTAFDVDIAGGGVRLAVYRGKVRFGGDGAADGKAVLVPAGWRTRFVKGAAQAPMRFNAAQSDWRQGWLDVDAMSLGELIEALNRRQQMPIAAPVGTLADTMISGRFRLDRPQQLLDAIGMAYGFDVQQKNGKLFLVANDGDTKLKDQ